MYISKVHIHNFRNFPKAEFTLSKGVNCLIGENNVGKSNLCFALRLVLDSALSSQRRMLSAEDFPEGTSIAIPQHLFVAVTFSDFQASAEQKGLLSGAVLSETEARFVYRFRPKKSTRTELAAVVGDLRPLTIDDYGWELWAAIPDAALSTLTWNQDVGTVYPSDRFQEGFKVTFMEALRDVEARLAYSRTSLLSQLINSSPPSPADQSSMVTSVETAQTAIEGNAYISGLATRLSTAFGSTSGSAHKMKVEVGLQKATFADVVRQLSLLLTGYGQKQIAVTKNGLGLNNILFVSLNRLTFQERIAKAKTAGQLLIIEEPEAHLHPQLQYSLLHSLNASDFQSIVTTHSTHITSALPLETYKVISFAQNTLSSVCEPALSPSVTQAYKADLERFLDATRSTLLFARKVMLVEGPAELFLLPPLIKKVMGIDLRDLGIDVIPIFGTHFNAYAALFGDAAIKKKCAVLQDGDQKASDQQSIDDDDEAPVPVATFSSNSQYIKLFKSILTLETELALPGNIAMFHKTCLQLAYPNTSALLASFKNDKTLLNQPSNMDKYRKAVLNSAKRTGKARFSQIASLYIDDGVELPQYVKDAVNWLITDAPN